METRKPPELLDPDDRWQILLGRYPDLVAAASRWPTHPAVKKEVGQMLETCRHLFAHSYFVYEFGPVAVVWSMFAVEAALRDRLGERVKRSNGLKKLIATAEDLGWLSPDQAEGLRAGAELRNRFVHAQTYGVFTPGQVAGVVEGAHAAVVQLYAAPPF
jgi:hypothetical protein